MVPVCAIVNRSFFKHIKHVTILVTSREGCGKFQVVPVLIGLHLGCRTWCWAARRLDNSKNAQAAQALYNSLFSVDSKMIMIQHDPTWSNNSAPRCSKMFQVAIFKKSSKSTFSTCWTSTIISGGASCGNLTSQCESSFKSDDLSLEESSCKLLQTSLSCKNVGFKSFYICPSWPLQNFHWFLQPVFPLRDRFPGSCKPGFLRTHKPGQDPIVDVAETTLI